jgi:crossover junction endodeoxyribonuclease RuvC
MTDAEPTQAVTRVLGIDPGIRFMGFGVVERIGTRLVARAYGVENVSREPDFQKRIGMLDGRIKLVAAEHAVQLAGIERVFAGKNMSTAIASAEGRGAVRLSLAQAKIPVSELAARDIKLAVTGRGGASKGQVAAMVCTILGITDEIDENAADALAVAIAVIQRLGIPGARKQGTDTGRVTTTGADTVLAQLMRRHTTRPRRRSR